MIDPIFSQDKRLILNRHHLIIAATVWIIGWLIVNLFTLTLYPAITCDETFYGKTAQLFKDGLLSDTPWPNPGWLFFLPHGRTAWFVQSIGITLFDTTLFGVRFYSLVGWLLSIVLSVVIGKQYTGSEKVGFWAGGLVSISWLGFYAGHHARPDMLAAAGIAGLLAWLPFILRHQQNWPFLAFGFALTFLLDLHFNLLHFIWPLTLLMLINLLRERRWWQASYLLLGMFAAGLVLIWIHIGPAMGYFSNQIFTDFNHVAHEYVRIDSEQTSLWDMARSFGHFWWQYYGAFARWLSYPQAILFLLGTIWAIVKPTLQLHRWLGWIIILSSLSYLIINGNYQIINYAMLWLPLYMVVAVAAIFSTFEENPWLSSTILALLGAAYLAGNIYLAITVNTISYQKSIDRLLAGSEFQSGDRIIANHIWYFALSDQNLTFLPETLVESAKSNAWFYGVPEEEQHDLPVIVQNISSIPQSPEDVNQRLTQILQPDYIIYTEKSNCPEVHTPAMIALTSWAESQCKLVNQIQTETYGQLSLFSCKP